MTVRSRALAHTVPTALITAALALSAVVLTSSSVHAWSTSPITVNIQDGSGSGTDWPTPAADQSAVDSYLGTRVQDAATQSARARSISDLEAQLAQAQAELANARVDGPAVMAVAARYKGVHYRRGGTTPKGFDCSGYTQFVFHKLGVSLPRVASAQYSVATKISRTNAKPGDLVFFHSKSGVYHVAIYAGSNMIWHSPRTGKSVEKVSIWTSAVTFGRIPQSRVAVAAAKKVARLQKALTTLKATQ